MSISGAEMSECIVCFTEVKVNERKSTRDFKELHKLCCTYLHSALTKRSVQVASDYTQCEENGTLCSKCFDSAAQLSDLAEQLKLCQTSISEFVLMFSLGVLHRRGQQTKAKSVMGDNYVFSRKYLQFDVSDLPGDNHWDFPTKTSANPIFSVLENTIRVSDDQDLFVNASDPLLQSTESEEFNYESESIVNVEISQCVINYNPSVFEFENAENETNKADRSDVLLSQAELNQEPKLLKASENKMLPVIKIERLEDFNKNPNDINLKSVSLGQRTFFTPNASIITPEDFLSASPNEQSTINCDSELKTVSIIAPEDFVSMPTEIVCSSSEVWQSSDFEQINVIDDNQGTGQFYELDNIEQRHTCIKGQLLFKCSNCHVGFHTKRGLQIHALKCRQLNSGKTSMNPLNQTALLSLSDSGKASRGALKCHICNKIFSSKKLRSHMVTHSNDNEKPFKCDQCDYSSGLSYNLHKHKFKHSNDRLFACPECGNSFKTNETMRRHYKRIHCSSKLLVPG